MQRLVQPVLRYLKRMPAAGLAAVAAGMFVTAGCTQVPDYANPAEWYRSAVDVFDDDAPPPPPAEEVPGAHEPFPSVGDVPDSPSRDIELSELDWVRAFHRVCDRRRVCAHVVHASNILKYNVNRKKVIYG